MIFGALFLCGYSSKYYVAYDSIPKGASLLCDGKDFGYADNVLWYIFSKEEKKAGVGKLDRCVVKYASGLSKEYPTEVDLKKFPDGARMIALRVMASQPI